jgi:hypothetical protein
MSKTPYEIRLELIKMAQEQLNQRYYTKYEVARFNAETEKRSLNEVPEFPDSAQILVEAEKLKSFIDKGDR